MKQNPAIVIFGQDLRLFDNPALCAAAQTKKPLIFAYIYSPNSKNLRALGSSQKWWLYHSLKELQISLKQHKAQLVLRIGNIDTELQKLIRESKADCLFYNDSFDPQWRKHYAIICHTAKTCEATATVCDANLLINPEKMKTQQGSYFKVYTPFWNKCLSTLDPPKPLAIPQWVKGPNLKSETLEKFKLLDHIVCHNLDEQWAPGEDSAKKHLKKFIDKTLNLYESQRNRLDLDSTSKLSPHIHFGELSIRDIWHSILHHGHSKAKDSFLREIGFREFSYYLLYHFPKMEKSNFNPQYDHFPWKKSKKLLTSWQDGLTGFPIVDAAMQQLRETGWMHNRARMIVASFLIKDLLIDWREGERWFWDLLVDADPAINAFNWQWVAGSGADPAPYFRIFNPTLQGETYDPKGEYVTRWLPELAPIKGKQVHKIHMLSHTKLEDHDIILDDTYPTPIVNHNNARDSALKAYKTLPKK